MDIHEYLRKEFRRYFPDAARIDVVVHNDGEAYDVAVHWNEAVASTWMDFHMDVGSDNDCFRFTNTETGSIITVPFAEWV